MNAVRSALDWSATSESDDDALDRVVLDRVIEPLANYICATDAPRIALFSALAALCRQVDATNGAATNHFRLLLADQC
jgi:hypothetical protein